MNTRPSYWLLLEKSDETRVSGGIDPYKDKTGEQYHYDSAVANARKVKSGDYAILRKENTILGLAEIGYYHATEREAYDLGLAFGRSHLVATGDEISILFRFSSLREGRKSVLRCAFIGAEAGDEIEVKLNNHNLGSTNQSIRNQTSPATTIWEGSLSALDLKMGENTLQLKLIKVCDQRTTPIKAGEFEILVPGIS